MAKRKKSKSSPSRRRGRVGAAGKSSVMSALYMIGGAVAGNYLTKVIPDNIGGVNLEKFKPAIPLVVGLFAPKFVKSPQLAPVFTGMVVGGGLNLAQSFGIGGVGYINAPMIGYTSPALLAGVDSMQMSRPASSTPFIGAVI